VEFAVLVPFLMVLFVAIADMARLYSTMVAIEAAAREAADYGAFDASKWGPDDTAVRQGMTHRACLAASDLADYVGTKDDAAATCTNPTVTIEDPIPQPADPAPGSTDCTNTENAYPCWVEVSLEYDFNMILPVRLEFLGVAIGFPSPLTFERTSVFAMTDLQLEPDPTPTPTPDPGATPTPTPDPAATPTPTPDPAATPTPTPDPAATPTPTPDPAATPTPTPTPDPGVTPTPTPPDPDVTPTPTPDPGATPTPDPGATPTPTPEV
jgi:hypothetical protein